VDDSDREMLLRSVERVVGVPHGVLIADDTQENRSLSYGEAELVRQFNGLFKANGWDDQLYGRYMRRGAVRRMKVNYRPSREEARIPTPRWAMERAADVGATSVRRITELGTHVIGDLDMLGELPEDRVGTPPSASVPPEAAAQAVAGAMVASDDPQLLIGQARGEQAGHRSAAPSGKQLALRLARDLVATGRFARTSLQRGLRTVNQPGKRGRNRNTQ